VAGQLVRTLVDESQAPRESGFSAKWNGTNDTGGPVSSGVYFYKLETGGVTKTKKMVLLK
jgi:flagellar hook assembly protein FlgD